MEFVPNLGPFLNSFGFQYVYVYIFSFAPFHQNKRQHRESDLLMAVSAAVAAGERGDQSTDRIATRK